MKRVCLLVLSTLLTVTAATAAPPTHPLPSFVGLAIADKNRPADDRALDDQRHPAAVLGFTGIKPGDVVVDLMPGKGYYTRLFSRMVGPKGKVYALQPSEMDKKAPKGLESVRSFAGTEAYPNVTVLVEPDSALKLPEPVDVIWTSQNYHDLHDPFMGKPDMATLDKQLFDALKPGGTLIVLDHAAAAGTGISKTDDLHRIDPAAVKSELTAAGFQFDGESDALLNPADDHTKPIFDASLKGHTDRFIYKFHKP
ncbi:MULTISPECIES: class I SAM-dependent methyltransferase [unclassified Dyella]|uniref:class I SAM-dependent methyltransferase n=1 Tax=unclassified Dyella TaxID=2634549 RepID=UPI000C82210A|nr:MULTISPECIES: class I SAM-dependent methyltransferase [unclassified Dyella]MDR3446559.1 class I SAM-dependent methyltransferase [Dyella sp.]PMQ03882.1 Ubiquinone/menaquinone biosynthesis C-methyltransferase UbiE [Dyella sp. AD56]